MSLPLVRFGSPARLRWPRRTARLRLTAVFGGLFLMSGAVLVAVTYGLFERASAYTRPRLPQVPDAPTINSLKLPPSLAKVLGPLGKLLGPVGAANPSVQTFQSDLRRAEYYRALKRPHELSLTAFDRYQQQLRKAQHQLAEDQHRLTAAVNHLAQTVHQVAQTSSVEAAQRAADSHQLLVNSGIALGIVALLTLVAGWLLAGRTLRPIRTITRTARRISSTSLHERLALDGPDDELKELGDTLDDLFGRLDVAFEAQRHFVANASHELRTPLTVDRSLLQVALDDPDRTAEEWRATAAELLASNDEQKDLIEALLALASSESGIDHREHTDVADICRAILPRPGPDADRMALQVETAIQPAPVDGDARLIERLATNLVDNAIGHNVVGGKVHISTGASGGRAFLSVTNTGPVIPPGEIDRLFQPFQRLDPRRTHHKNGHGLGLSIVRAIALSHHANIDAAPLPDGGLSVTVTFPPPATGQPATRTRRLAASCR